MYLKMTLAVRLYGLQINAEDELWVIPSGKFITSYELGVEKNYSGILITITIIS